MLKNFRLALLGLSVASLLLGAGCALPGSSPTPYETKPTINSTLDDQKLISDLDKISNQASTNTALKNEDVPPSNLPSETSNSTTANTNKPMEFDAKKHYTALLKTSAGDIEIALNFGQTPNTVKNFVDLARKNFYDNTIFHRVLKGFMIQGGDPEGDGTGGPGYRFDDELFTGEYTRGTVAMANAGPNTNGSQFFIMHADYPLPKNYTIFGQVIKGLEVVDKIATSEVKSGTSGEPSTPVAPTVVKSVVITEK
ncbi:MAG: peptidylprolyl isomerase [Candidatus Magasanikbacteria bacterium]|nr:peptidylprolyl isomerase [Candidatus Magasanikbacteria bacterium]